MMKESVGKSPNSFQRAIWLREDAEDAERWEAQIRNMAKQEAYCEAPVRTFAQPVACTTLQVANRVTRRDSLLIARTLPVLTGNDAQDLLCGKCSGVIGARTSMQSARRLHPEGDGLFVRCTCATLNVIYEKAICRKLPRNRIDDRTAQ